jgi:hypothetical protein
MGNSSSNQKSKNVSVSSKSQPMPPTDMKREGINQKGAGPTVVKPPVAHVAEVVTINPIQNPVLKEAALKFESQKVFYYPLHFA